MFRHYYALLDGFDGLRGFSPAAVPTFGRRRSTTMPKPFNFMLAFAGICEVL